MVKMRDTLGRLCLGVLLLAAGLAGCGNADRYSASEFVSSDAAYEGGAYDSYGDMEDYKGDSYDSYDDVADADYGLENSMESPRAVPAEGSQKETAVPQNNGAKLIKRYSFRYETEQFDDAYAFLLDLIGQYGGYVSDSQVSGTSSRDLELTARIPAKESDKFAGKLGRLGTLLGRTESAEDVTLQYADTESRIAALKTEQERLNELLGKAENLEAIIALESRMTEVRYELENYQSKKNLYDNLISYSTVNISLREVIYTVPIDDSTVFSRIKTGLKSSLRDVGTGLENLFVAFIVAIPYLVVWLIGIVIFVKLCKLVFGWLKKRHEKKKVKREEKKLKKQQKKEEAERKRAEALQKKSEERAGAGQEVAQAEAADQPEVSSDAKYGEDKS